MLIWSTSVTFGWEAVCSALERTLIMGRGGHRCEVPSWTRAGIGRETPSLSGAPVTRFSNWGHVRLPLGQHFERVAQVHEALGQGHVAFVAPAL